ncbi:ArsC family reductase [Pelomonas sp. SE-A7]|uniref:ArsC family reductase n=1 Tax=Pelomonas sp. SE-A7 TaxID=3054953 RepID=UPI00259D115F|nr:ArsC family reductase [Pelomonas sp. SE-A7]MDM4764726.1 ArsC family reductase [Pelomonas sp. SE-A7]
MSITLYGIPNCDTVKRARLWLDEHDLAYQFHDFKKAGVPAEPLARWLKEFGWEKVVNRAGTSWRKLDEAQKAAVVDAASATALVHEQPSVIKRPVVQWADGRLSIGFNEALFASHGKE